MRRRAFVAGAAVALAAPRAALAAEPKGEVGILRSAVELEQLTAYVYDAGVKSGLLDSKLASAVTTLRDHERRHADALASHVGALGSTRPPAPRSPADADDQLARLGLTGRLGEVRTAPAFLELALELELRQVAAYTAAAGDLEDVRMIQTTASILAAQGTHLVVIREALGRAQLPNPLETGRP